MNHTEGRNIQELESVLHAAAGDLSLAHVAVLVEHPEAVTGEDGCGGSIGYRNHCGRGVTVGRRPGIGQNFVKEELDPGKGKNYSPPTSWRSGLGSRPASPSMSGGRRGGSSAGKAPNAGMSSRRVSLTGVAGR